jgi:hypothetical protein
MKVNKDALQHPSRPNAQGMGLPAKNRRKGDYCGVTFAV